MLMIWSRLQSLITTTASTKININVKLTATARLLSSSFVAHRRSSSSSSSSEEKGEEMRVLNVAEKNDAAKSLAQIMARGASRRREGLSVYNKIYDFSYQVPIISRNEDCDMVMTSVSGHLLDYDFSSDFRKWYSCDPKALFTAPIEEFCPDNFDKIRKTLEREVRRCGHLIIWTDCDREGENIGFEIIDVCRKVKPGIRIYRAQFSEITTRAVQRAIENLVQPDKKVSDAVTVRRLLDLRIGAAFTRFQTMQLQRKLPPISLNKLLISYGSCQFPTLGFVVERYKQIVNFVSRPFWYLDVVHTKDEIKANFIWKRSRLYDEDSCLAIFAKVMEKPEAKVIDVQSKKKTKWRPQPMDTVSLEKLSSSKLKINAKKTMTIAEKLYTQGFISYPRTETTIFPPDIDLVKYVEMHTASNEWGQFARRVLEWTPQPRQGKKTDKAHPPIHPTKYIPTLAGDERKVYELIVRHFLACLSRDAIGSETSVEIDINEEKFHCSGLAIHERNYLDVYPYEKWNSKEIPRYNMNEHFIPESIMMNDGKTSPPQLLTEAELISLMDKHGIGTDATHAEHIETIKSRHYVGLTPDNRFIPGYIGIGLVEGYDEIGYEMSKPHLRSDLERDLKDICEGRKDPNVVLRDQLQRYERVFLESVQNVQKLENGLRKYIMSSPENPTKLCEL